MFLRRRIRATSLRHRHAVIAALCIAGAVPLAVYLALPGLLPQAASVTSRAHEGREAAGTLPLPYTNPSPVTDLTIALRVGALRASLYHVVFPRTCILAMRLNGKPVDIPEEDRCDDGLGRIIALPGLKQGENVLAVTLREAQPMPGIERTFHLRTARMDPAFFLPTLLGFFLGAIAIILAIIVFVPAPFHAPAAIAAGGAMLRILYALATHYSQRSDDWAGHARYVLWFARHWAIPAAAEGWETYHPPLFYAISALWLRLGSLVGRRWDLLFADIQTFSLLLSLGTLGCAFWIGRMLFPRQEDRPSFLLFSACVATFPALVLLSSRISNDALVTALEFLALALFLHWRTRRDTRGWYACCAALSLGLLTKNSVLPLALALFLAAALLRAPLAERARLMLRGAAIIAVLVGWYALLRWHLDGSLQLVGNVERLFPALGFPQSWTQFVIFSPWRVLHTTYADAIADASGRQMFWEYFFKTAYLGAFQYGEALRGTARLLLLGAMLQIPVAIFGWWTSLKRDPHATLLMILAIVVLASHLLFRLRYPFASSQDFRYSVVLVVPLAFFLTHGIAMLPERLRSVGLACVILTLLLSASFPALLFLAG